MPIKRADQIIDSTRRPQRGAEGADLLGMSGITYEVTGPFFI